MLSILVTFLFRQEVILAGLVKPLTQLFVRISQTLNFLAQFADLSCTDILHGARGRTHDASPRTLVRHVDLRLAYDWNADTCALPLVFLGKSPLLSLHLLKLGLLCH